MSTQPAISRSLLSLLDSARASNHRCLLVLAGSESWCYSQARSVLKTVPNRESLWVGQDPIDSLLSSPAGKARQWLGRELDLLFFDAHCGFDVDAFGALSGTVRGGGLLVLLVPELDSWPDFSDPEYRRMVVYPEGESSVSGRYLRRLSGLIREETALSVLTESGLERWQRPSEADSQKPFAGDLFRTGDQQRAVAAIKRVATGHRRRPLVLTADRGRGKSAALGIAAAQLLMAENSVSKIVVSAPSLASAEVVFRHAQSLLEGAESVNGYLRWKTSSLTFCAPDELAESAGDSDLVLVDEAAAIPAPLLESFLRRYSRIVFASTVHGYEGTGRGFAVRFRKTLDHLTPQWAPLHINEPVRWASLDPVESFVFKILMLNAAPVASECLESVTLDQCQLVRFDRDHLVENEGQLNELFGLLVLAHYRTRPFDLRHLLDGPNIEVYGCLFEGRVVATVLAAREGGIEEGLAEAVWLGQRRVRGHLIPQSLSNHVGIPEAVVRRGLRILRIAVHPAVQRKGIGNALVDFVSAQAKARQFDYVGSSFGATSDLLAFWGGCGLVPVRVGLSREAASGCHSLMVLKPLSQAGKALQSVASERFRESLLLQLPDTLRDLDPGIVCGLLAQSCLGCSELSEADRRDVHSFARGNRLYECCLPALRRQLLIWLCDGDCSNQPENLSLVIMKILQNRPWSELAGKFRFAGRNQVIAAFRAQFIEDKS